eukprot:PhF_6_TR9998/c0_g1_i1/m.15211/K15202/GTF3C5, TFC1; general transcription factor 3C polypeptide 5 (transcription factor C subunit 1)
MIGGANQLKSLVQEGSTADNVILQFAPHSPKIFGKTESTNDVLLKIRRKKGKIVGVEALGIIHSTVSFSGVADFAYLPPKSLSQLSNPSRPFGTLDDVTTSEGTEPLYLPPHLFAKIDSNFGTYNYMGSSVVESTHTYATSHSPMISWKQNESPIPTAPHPASQKLDNPIILEWIQVMRNAFQERPITMRMTLQEGTLTPNKRTSVIFSHLSVVAFRIETGCFTNMWCRFGYDFRTNQENVMWQPIILHIKQSIIIQLRRRIAAHKQSHNRPARFATTKGLPKATPIRFQSYTMQQICDTFIEKGLRRKCYQICDIDDETVKSIVHSQLRETYDPVHGYLNPAAITTIRGYFTDCLIQQVDKKYPSEDPSATLEIPTPATVARFDGGDNDDDEEGENEEFEEDDEDFRGDDDESELF